MIRMPRFRSMVQHRMLINYRVDAHVARTLVPDGMRPQLVNGYAVAGICHIRQNKLRPAWLKPEIGLRAESSAHRIAVEWDDETGTHSGVYVAERHSSSPLVRLAGGRLVPGVQQKARIESEVEGDTIRLQLASAKTTVDAEVSIANELRSVLWGEDLHAASEFFRTGFVGWSPGRRGGVEALRIDTDQWKVVPAAIIHVESSFFDTLPEGSAELDCVLVLRNVPFDWSAPTDTPQTGERIGPPHPIAS